MDTPHLIWSFKEKWFKKAWLFEVVPSLCITFLRELIYEELSAVKMAALEF